MTCDLCGAECSIHAFLCPECQQNEDEAAADDAENAASDYKRGK